jgi:integrase
VALRIKGKGSVFQDVPVPGRLSAALLEWKGIQEEFKGRRILAPGGIAFAGSQFVFAGYSGAPFSNRAFNLRLRAACRAIGVGEITAHGLRHSAATILLNHAGKGFAGNSGAPPPQEYPHHRALHPRRLRADPADGGGTQPSFGVKVAGVAIR